MTLEAILAYLHLLAILTMVVFVASEAALCRAQWLNAAVVERLAKVDMVYGIAAIAVLATGIARTWWGVKGTAWYWTNPLLHVKLGLFIIVGVLSIYPTVVFASWKGAVKRGEAPVVSAEAARRIRLCLFLELAGIAGILLAAPLMARGIGSFG